MMQRLKLNPSLAVILRELLPALAMLALTATGIIAAGQGCQQTGLTSSEDSRAASLDAGGRNCDAVANEWQVQSTAQASWTGDAGVAANIFSVWGASPSAIYAVGSHGKVLFYDGKSWKSQVTKTRSTLTSVWGVSAKNVWAVGYDGVVIRYDKASGQWKDVSPPDIVFVSGDGGVPKGDAAASLRGNLQGVWVAGSGTMQGLVAVGDDGLVLFLSAGMHWTSKVTIRKGGAPYKIQDQLTAVWGTGLSKFFVVGKFGTWLDGAATSSSVTLDVRDTAITKDLFAVWGRNNTDVYAVGTGGTILHYTGGGVTTPPKVVKAVPPQEEKIPRQVLRGIWGPASDNSLHYVVGWDGTLFRLTGGPAYKKGPIIDPFYCVVPMRHLWGIWGFQLTSPTPAVDAGVPLRTRVWVVGASGMVIQGP